MRSKSGTALVDGSSSPRPHCAIVMKALGSVLQGVSLRYVRRERKDSTIEEIPRDKGPFQSAQPLKEDSVKRYMTSDPRRWAIL